VNRPERDEEDGPRPEVFRIYPGQPYRYHRLDSGGNTVWGTHYAPLFFAECAQSRTDKVVYVGLDGADRGKHFLCSLTDWELRFTRVRPKEVPAGSSEKIAGAFLAGSGV
jgi:hypothetical protein